MPQLNRANLPDPSPALQSQETVTPVDYSQIGKAVIATGVKAYGEAGKSAFEGDSTKATLGEEWTPEDIKNLQDLKRAREQNKISASGARLKVGQLVKEMGSRWPGLEDTFRRQADTFFGKFGQGDMLLDTKAEDQARKLFETKFLGPGVEAGIINPYDPYGDVQGQQNWKKMITDNTIRKHQLDVAEGDYKLGNLSAQELGRAYIASEVDSDIGFFLNQQVQRMERGDKNLDDKELMGIVEAKKQQQRLALNQKLMTKHVDAATRKQLMDEIDYRWDGVSSMVKANSFSTWLQGKGEMLRQWGVVYGAAKYPELFALEQAMPGGGAALLKHSDVFARLKTPAQREAYISSQPPMTQQLLRSLGENPTNVVPLLDNLINGKTTTGIEGIDSITLGIARDYAGTPATSDNPAEKEQKGKAAEAVLLHDSPKNIMTMAVQPGAVASIYNDKTRLGQLQATVDHTYASVVDSLHGDFIGTQQASAGGRGMSASTIPQADYIVTLEGKNFVFTSAETGKATQRRGRTGQQVTIFPEDVKKKIDQLNRINQVVNIYGPVMGIKPDQWRRDTVLRIMGGPNAKAQANPIPKQGEVVDGYTFIGGDPKDPNNWKKQ